MLNLTQQERMVLSVLIVVFLAGSMLNYVFKRYPFLEDVVNVVDSSWIYQKIDINTAALEELISVPHIGAYTAGKIIEYRQENGAFTDLLELKNVKGVRDKNYEKFILYLKIKGK